MALLFPLLNLSAGAVIEAGGEILSGARDRNGDTVGGIGSGVVYDGEGDVFLCLSDRGPGDGTVPYRPRFVAVKVTQTGDKLNCQIVGTVIFQDENGRDMTGLIPDDPGAGTPRMKDGRTCIDPEAIALGPAGQLFVTDEYGPYLYEFQRDGKMVRRIALPEEFQPINAEGKIDFSDSARLVSGRAINRGPEGMCLLPGGLAAALIFQSAPVRDGGGHAGRTKMIFLDLATGKHTATFVYPMSPDEAGVAAEKLSVNDLVALDRDRFLVLEREGRGRDGNSKPSTARYKAVWLADTSEATNLLGHPPGSPVTPVQKNLLFNLASLVEAPERLAAKWEGLAVIARPNEREITLLMTADNDFLTPVIYDGGARHGFPRAKDAVPTQLFKIRVPLPEKP